ncbi:hypothetical protein TCON_1306 [Astathelohania contejeani]|uniref:Uncharacterized protein n=1 Tax=Astathelohania contejeani TaxID=164912 RepID=A0ABQ7HZ61_9MICR|nr:hypothetical protein TCON_1306 [Thelohania contejeani]
MNNSSENEIEEENLFIEILKKESKDTQLFANELEKINIEDWSHLPEPINLRKVKRKKLKEYEKKEIIVPISIGENLNNKIIQESRNNPKKGFKILMKGLRHNPNNSEIWNELILNYFSKIKFNILDKIINVKGSLEFYLKLWNETRDLEYIKRGLEVHPDSIELYKILIENESNIQNIKDGSIKCKTTQFIDKHLDDNVLSFNDIIEIYDILKQEKLYSRKLFEYFLIHKEELKENIKMELLNNLLNGFENLDLLLNFDQNFLEKNSLFIFKKLKKVAFKRKSNMFSDILSTTPKFLKDLILSLKRISVKSFLIIYDILKFYVSDFEFIKALFNRIEAINMLIFLIKCKEIWKLLLYNIYINNDYSLLDKLKRYFKLGMQRFSRHKKYFLLAQSKVYFRLKDYLSSYQILKNIKSIKKYVILSKISLEDCLLKLSADLISYKHYLLYCEILDIKGDKENVKKYYLIALEKYTDNYIEIGCAYIRWLKYNGEREDVFSVIDKLLLACHDYDIFWYEKYSYMKRMRLDYRNILLEGTKATNSKLLKREKKFVLGGDSQNILIKVRRMVSSDEFSKNEAYKFINILYYYCIENADSFIIIFYLIKNYLDCDKELLKNLELKILVSDLNTGIYWPRVYKTLRYNKIIDKLEYGLELLEYDCFWSR